MPTLAEPVVLDWVNGIPKSVLYATVIDPDFAQGIAPTLARLSNASSGNVLTTLHFNGANNAAIDFRLNFSSSHYFELLRMYDRYLQSNNLVIDRLQVPISFSGLQIELVFDAAFLNQLFANVELEIAGTATAPWNTTVQFNFIQAPDNLGNWGWADGTPINPGNDG